jgi:hypothetical protein
MREREGKWRGDWEVRFTYGTGGDSVYRLASDQSRESEEDDDVAIHFFDILAPLDLKKKEKKKKGKEKKRKEKERKGKGKERERKGKGRERKDEG